MGGATNQWNDELKRPNAMKLEEIKKKLDDLWKKLDADGNEVVTKEELQKALMKGSKIRKEVTDLFATSVGTSKAPQVLERLDTDSDEQISKDEFYMQFLIEANLMTVFKSAASEDGTMTRDQLEKLLVSRPELDMLMTRRGVKPIYVFEQMDADGDKKVS